MGAARLSRVARACRSRDAGTVCREQYRRKSPPSHRGGVTRSQDAKNPPKPYEPVSYADGTNEWTAGMNSDMGAGEKLTKEQKAAKKAAKKEAKKEAKAVVEKEEKKKTK